jgi:hypothetical protein
MTPAATGNPAARPMPYPLPVLPLLVIAVLSGLTWWLEVWTWPFPLDAMWAIALWFAVVALVRRFVPRLRPKPAFGPPIAFAPGEYAVTVEAHRDRLRAVAEVRRSLDLTLGQARDRLENLPATVVRDVARADADELATRLRAVGATVTVTP